MKTRIYIADDHPILRKGLSTLLTSDPGFEVCGEAGDCATATSEIIKLKPDLVLVDISLKSTSGIELIKNIKAFDNKLPVLVVSMHDESLYALRALKAGAKGYVMKQDIANKVMEGIERVLKGQLYFSEKVASQAFSRIVKGSEADSDSPIAGLSDRELEIVNLIGAGLSTREIAARLYVSVKTVETHRAHIKTKKNLRTATQLVQFCVRWLEKSRQTAEAGPSGIAPEEASDPKPSEGAKRPEA